MEHLPESDDFVFCKSKRRRILVSSLWLERATDVDVFHLPPLWPEFSDANAGVRLPHLSHGKPLRGTARDRRMVLQWMPAHCGIPGHEVADQLAKRGATRQLCQLYIYIKRKKETLIRSALGPQITRGDFRHLVLSEHAGCDRD